MSVLTGKRAGHPATTARLALPTTGSAARPDGVSGPVIYDQGLWY